MHCSKQKQRLHRGRRTNQYQPGKNTKDPRKRKGLGANPGRKQSQNSQETQIFAENRRLSQETAANRRKPQEPVENRKLAFVPLNAALNTVSGSTVLNTELTEFSGLTEFRGASSVSSSQPIIVTGPWATEGPAKESTNFG